MNKHTKLKDIWHRPGELIETAKERTLTSDELLALKSRSFYGPIKLLTIAKGKHEVSKEEEVRNAYNLLRALDTIEDGTLDNEDKYWVIDRLVDDVIGEVVRRGRDDNIEEIISGSDFTTVTQRLIEGSVDGDERVFSEHFGRGLVLQELSGFNRDIREAIDYSVKSMGGGMKTFLRRGEIQTDNQLRHYCYHVAGRIGSLLTRLIELKDKDLNGNPVRLDSFSAEKFGEFLQLTNISKNVREDYKHGRVFFPAIFRPLDISHGYLMKDQGDGAITARQQVLDSVLSMAEENFAVSVDYVRSIPSHLSGYKAFCLVPLISAKGTIDNMKKVGAEALFRGDEEATKVPYSIHTTMGFSYSLATQDKGKHADGWLKAFGKNPEDFSFEPGNYMEWSPKWIKEDTTA